MFKLLRNTIKNYKTFKNANGGIIDYINQLEESAEYYEKICYDNGIFNGRPRKYKGFFNSYFTNK